VTNIPVSGKVLIWARKERGLELDVAAKRLGISESELDELEQEKRLPTVTELRKMAAKYEIGFSALLMPAPLPPNTRLKVQDFRTHQSVPEKWHPDLLTEMDDLNVVIDAMADLRDVEPSLLQASLPKITTSMIASRVAADERKRIGLDIERQAAWKTDADAFRRFRAIVEAQGIFVYLINASTIEDWRGLAIYDERQIPVIVLNGDETEPAARSFSLFHEYAHILLRQSVISDQRSKGASEIFCNRFAACFLMPVEEFKGVATTVGGGYRDYWTDTQLRKIGSIFKTSMSAVALRLESIDLAPDGFYRLKWGEWQVRKKLTKKKGPVAYYEKIANRLGSRYIAIVFDALDRGRVNQLDAYEMLDVQAVNFPKLRAEIRQRQATYGWSP
jgi:Zn-dependent peptidase ImmA (M78 family)/DNA-binding XRE family transcriptional regulator